LGGSSKTTDTKSTTAPWSAQQPYLLDAWGQAKGLYDKNTKEGAYSGDYVAAPNQDQYDINQQAIDFAKGLGQSSSNALLNTGTGNLGTGSDYIGKAGSGLYDYSQSDTLGNTISGANRVAQGFNVSGAVDAAMRDANRIAAEDTLPSLYRGSSATGNINSDRAALSEGVVKRGLAEKAADLSAELQNENYQTGLKTAQDDTTSRLGALSDLGSLGSSTLNSGIEGISSGISSAAKNLGIGSAAAEDNQGLAQDILDNAIAKYEGKQDYGWDQLAKYYGITGDKNWGSEETKKETVKDNPSTLSTIGSGIGAVGALSKGGGLLKK
jgi:hypothetical protein